MKKISVIGMGSWGTTLAILLAEKGFSVNGWEWMERYARAMQRERENKLFLPNCAFPENLKVTNNLNETVSFADIIVIAVPSQFVRKTISKIRNELKCKHIISVTKGMEADTLMRMSEVIIQETGAVPENVSVLSGPTHAEEVSKKLPATIVAVSINEKLAKEVQRIFMTDYFRVYTSSDIIGVELGAALKNVIAIGAGIADGMKLGDNSKAALITRGLREITRLGVKCGANPHTFSGISGIGDLIVTCESRHSRNRFVGEQLAKGKTLKEITDSMEMIAEGIKTTQAAYKLSKKMNVEMPITNEIYNILFNEFSPQEGLKRLMTRSAKSEDEF
ncbi:MAG: NAD(P)H-dependent glycerol-3-phosphate dehydrogenase [Candidatus Cloacimonetes bacterium]|nr:NAD(P)H-dependent glycerol-3-phosphate dehydrogenase [Candidatus Cloacimonadota bacterium]